MKIGLHFISWFYWLPLMYAEGSIFKEDKADM